MRVILACDIATRTGWAVGQPGERPEYGADRMAEVGAPEGKIFSLFAGWVGRMIEDHHVTDIFAEAQYIPRASSPRLVKVGTVVSRPKRPPVDMAVINRLIGMRAVAKLVAWRRNIAYNEVPIGEITKAFTGFSRHGSREDKKKATIAMAEHYGFPVGDDDDKADGLAIFFYAEAKLAPYRHRAAGPLFVGLRG